MSDVNKQLLGGMSASAFLRRHWQKQPLLIREAMPRFEGILDFGDMVELACRDDGESRLVWRHAGQWTVEHGPFERKRFSRLPPRNWTLMLQGIEQRLPAARHLLSHFDFIPYSRLDDLMVSFAASGGGVGAHFDSYDVFLLQGPGQRRWQVGRPSDLTLMDSVPLKMLKRFLPDGQCLLSAGDMLYLPPEFAHEGIAVGTCYTYSIGFRAPSQHELISQFLIFLEDKLASNGRYTDADLAVQAYPAHIGNGMITKVEHLLGEMSWTRRDVAEFLGVYLTEPKSHVLFAPPRKARSEIAFSRMARRTGVELALPSQMLYANTTLFLNGEAHKPEQNVQPVLRHLADTRRLPGRLIPLRGPVTDILYHWYRAGYIYLSKPGLAR